MVGVSVITQWPDCKKYLEGKAETAGSNLNGSQCQGDVNSMISNRHLLINFSISDIMGWQPSLC